MRDLGVFPVGVAANGHVERSASEEIRELLGGLDLVFSENMKAGNNVRFARGEDVLVTESVNGLLATRLIDGVGAVKSDKFIVSIPISGEFYFSNKNTECNVGAGDALFYHSQNKRDCVNKNGAEFFLIHMSGDVIRNRIPLADDRCRCPKPLRPFLAPVIATLASRILSCENPPDMIGMQDVLLDLVCKMLEAPGDPTLSPSMRRALVDITYERALGYMQRHFNDPELTPAQVALALRVSPRTLRHIFQGQGRTFSQTLLEIRLEIAHRILSTPTEMNKRPNIGEIAFDCGFVNQAHFSTRFHEAFGVTPKSVMSNASPPLKHSPKGEGRLG